MLSKCEWSCLEAVPSWPHDIVSGWSVWHGPHSSMNLKHFLLFGVGLAYNVFQCAKCWMWIKCSPVKETSPCGMSCPDMRIDIFVAQQDDLFWQYIKRVSWLAGQGTSYSQNAGDINTGKALCSDSPWIAKWWQAHKFISQTVLHGIDIAMHWKSSSSL